MTIKEPQTATEQSPNRERLPHPGYYITSGRDDTALVGEDFTDMIKVFRKAKDNA